MANGIGRWGVGREGVVLESSEGVEDEDDHGGVCFGAWSIKSSMGLSLMEDS